MIAILSVTSEWSQRSGLTTFTLIPHRKRVITAKAISSVTVGVVSVLLAFVIGALGNLAGAAITGAALVWNVTLTECLYFVLGNVLSLLIGFMLGVLIRASAGAIAAYFVYSFLLPTVFGLLAASVTWFRDLQPWVDVQFAQSALFLFEGALTGEQWANIAVTGGHLAGHPDGRRTRLRDESRGQVAMDPLRKSAHNGVTSPVPARTERRGSRWVSSPSGSWRPPPSSRASWPSWRS